MGIKSQYIFIRVEHAYRRVLLAEILYIEASKNYCRVVTTDNIWMVLTTLREMEAALPAGAFCRIHRSFIVSVAQLSGFDNRSVFIGDTVLPIGDTQLSALLAMAPVVGMPKKAREGVKE
jgi:DNA-binding LytR/AlgR family response regulator